MKTDIISQETDEILTQTLAARLNHDYVSPLTAISNALEIIKLDETQKDMAMHLIEQSVGSALRELQFNRIAFGSYGEDEKLTVNELKRRLNDYFSQGDCKPDLSALTEPPLKSDAKLWFLGILCLKSSFLTIEELSIQKNDDGWKIHCKGTGKLDRNNTPRAEGHWLRIANISPNMVHFPLLFAHAERMKYDVILKDDGDLGMIINFWKNSQSI